MFSFLFFLTLMQLNTENNQEEEDPQTHQKSELFSRKV